jgi:hypothetical protein
MSLHCKGKIYSIDRVLCFFVFAFVATAEPYSQREEITREKVGKDVES